jgi:hypothetical protein
MRWSWLVVGGVTTLLVFAGVDTLRSSADSEISAPTASTTTASLPSCTQQDIRISIEIRAGIANVVARNVAGHLCYRLLHAWRLAINDAAGNQIAHWEDVRDPLVEGIFPADVERAFVLPQSPVACDSPGPYVAVVTVDPYIARRGNLSRSEVACGFNDGPQGRRLRATYISRAGAICRKATATLVAATPGPGTDLTPLEIDAAWSKAAARASERALAKLRKLPAPVDRARLGEIMSVMERQTDVLRRMAVAASAGDVLRFQTLSALRIRLTHRKDDLILRLEPRWDASTKALSECPVGLPA